MNFTVGIDEAGRGCMWGSVFAGAVILPEELSNEDIMTEKEKFLIRDSKKLSEKRRDEAAELIKERSIAWGVGECTPEEIDHHNILNATHTAMHRAVNMCYEKLCKKHPGSTINLKIDGNSFRIYYIPHTDNIVDHECVVEGDSKYRCISAASILAKTTRDKYVVDIVNEKPEIHEKWGLAKHKGYCTKQHMDAIQEYGIHELHRKSYAPIKRILNMT